MKQFLLSKTKTLLIVFFSIMSLGVAWGQSETAVNMTWNVSSMYSVPGDYYNKLVNLTLQGKTFTANQWTVMTLPFNCSKSVLDVAFTAGYEVQEFTSMTGDEFNFTKFTGDSFTLVAGTPYIIKTNATVSSVVFSGVRLTGGTDQKITYDEGAHYLQGKLFNYYGYTVWSNNVCYLWKINDDNLLAHETSWVDTYPGIGGYFGATDASKTLTLNIEGYSVDVSKLDLTNTANLNYAISKKEQLTNIPTVYITIPDAQGKVLNDVVYKDQYTKEALYHSATIRVIDNSDLGSEQHLTSFEDEVEIKVRGNSTSSKQYGKVPYRLKFAKKHKHDLLGLGYEKRNWTLLANYLDPTMVRNALTYRLNQLVGEPFCPGYKFVDLVINDEYRGTYQISDHVEVGTNRIDVDEETGWYVECARQDMCEEPQISAAGMQMSIKNPEPESSLTDPTAAAAETAQMVAALKTDVINWFTNWATIMDKYNSDAATFRDPATGWRSLTDEETLVNLYTAINFTGDYDGFMTVKMYRETNGKLCLGPIWDKDLAYGNYDNGSTLVENMDNGLFKGRVKAVWTDPVFMKKVHDKMKALTDAGIVSELQDYVDMLANQISKSQKLDEIKWPIANKGSFAKLTGNTFAQGITQLKQYLGSHITFVKGEVDKQYMALGGDAIVDNTAGDTPVTRQQLTNLPTIYIDATVGSDWSTASLEVFDKDNKLTQGTTWTSTAVEVQYQGGNSEGTKDSYRLKFDSKTQLLASGKFKQWVLASNDDDPSLINNALAKELGDLVGMPFTPGYQFVDLYVNNTYMGTYQVTDRIKTESGRALVTGGNKDNDWHVRINDNDEITEGGYKTTEYVAATSSMPNLVIKNPDPDDLTEATLATLKGDMNTWFTSFFGQIDGHYANVESNVDKQQIFNWYICQEVLAIYKGLSSVEAYRSITATDQTLHFGPLWDNETAFGNRGDEDAALSMSDLNTANSYNGLIFKYNKYGVMKSFIEDLWTQDWFKTGVPAKWNALVEAGLLTTLKSKASTISATLEQSQQKNLEKWSNSLKTKSNTYSTYSAAVAAISTYLDQRVPYLTKKFNALGTTCTTHTYANGEYAEQTDGTYRRACDNCGAAEEEGETYYQFIVYPESGSKSTVYAKSWTPSAEHPNSIAVVKASQDIVSNIEGYNIVCGNKNADGNLTCKDFRLTDGHPYYSDNKFVATTATYTRTLGSNEDYGTIILPYKYQNASTDDADFYHISSVAGKIMVLTPIDPDTDGNASAYTPVIFKRKNSASSITVTGVNITVKKSSAEKFNSTFEGWTLTGVMETTTVNTGTLYEITDAKNGKIGNVSSVTVNPFRAYFTNTNSVTTPLTFSISSPGDVNVDGKIDDDDVSALGSYIINTYTGTFNPIAADVNGDGKISIADVTALIEILK